MKTKSKTNLIKFISRVAIFSAVAIILDITLSIPIFLDFLKLKFPDVLGLLAGFMFGPLAGVFVQVIRVLANCIINGTSTLYIGEAFDLISGILLVLPASLIYKYKKDIFGALWGILASIFITIGFATVFNLIVMLPLYSELYYGSQSVLIEVCARAMPSIKSLSDIVLKAILPFNIIKYTIIGVITLLAYKQLHRFIKFVENKIYQEEFVEEIDNSMKEISDDDFDF
jgi:riboflavin transporter FmnP